jgi:prevent-host-death family protein
MTVVLALADAQEHLSDLVEHVAAGEEIIMVKAGQPVARLLPMEPLDQDDGTRRRVRTLQAGFSDPAAIQVQWASISARS